MTSSILSPTSSRRHAGPSMLTPEKTIQTHQLSSPMTSSMMTPKSIRRNTYSKFLCLFACMALVVFFTTTISSPRSLIVPRPTLRGSSQLESKSYKSVVSNKDVEGAKPSVIASQQFITTITAPSPQIVWLMSFPNSGTSYTGLMVKTVSKTATATNYGRGNVDASGQSVPIIPNDWNGVFWIDPKRSLSKGEHTTHTGANTNPRLPDEYILTKTHCGGFCNQCRPQNYQLDSSQDFLDKCVKTTYKQIVLASNSSSDDGDNGHAATTPSSMPAQVGSMEKKKGSYSSARVAKAIHLIRNPFDNIVSRFHLEINNFQKISNESVPFLMNTKEGFRSFCQEMDHKYSKHESKSMLWNESDAMKELRSIPCHADFYRWLRWHEMAIKVTQELEIQTMVLKYEEFDHDLEATVDRVMDFLSLERKARPPDFIKGKAYRDYFEPNELKRISQILKKIAPAETWELIHHYFDG